MGLLFRTGTRGVEKITRDAFLYLDPKAPADRFAQCSTCFMWTGPRRERCTIHGPNVPVTASMSCGFYIHGKPGLDKAGQEAARVTPTESGLVNRAVRCEDCRYLDRTRSRCRLFEQLNETFPEQFALDAAVQLKGCCNAQTPL